MSERVRRFAFDFGVSGSAAAVSKTLVAPFERAKFIIQNQEYALDVLTGKQRPYAGVVDLFRRVPREQGVLSLWRGNGANLARYFPSQALNFSLYQYYEEVFAAAAGGGGAAGGYGALLARKLLAGALAGSCSAAVVFPLDFCQTRLALDLGGGGGGEGGGRRRPREFDGILACFYKVARRDGVRGLYTGLHLSVVGFGVYRAFYFALYDLAKVLYARRRDADAPVARPPLALSLVAAQACTVAAGLLSYPLDTMARHMMLDSGRPRHLRRNRTIAETGGGIWRRHGARGFYRGALVNAMRCTAGALVLVLYDEFVYYASKWRVP